MLAPVLPAFLAAHPQVRLELDIGNRRVDVLAEGFDAALRVRAQPSGEDGLVMRQFAQLGELLVASPGYLATAGTPQRPSDLPGHATLAFVGERERPTWRLAGPQGEVATVEIVPRLGGHDFPLLHTAALAGLGVALLPASVVREALAAGTLVRVLPDWQLPQGVFHVVYPHRRGLLPAVRAFIEFLVATMPAAAAALPSCPPDPTAR
jgi:DNA-binding transcriptional LysR family regulator